MGNRKSCVGTSIGGAPLFAVPLPSVDRLEERGAFLEFADWHREEDSHLVMRLRPERAVRLFGPYVERIEDALTRLDVAAGRKYVLVGNMVAPVMAQSMAEAIAGSPERA